MDGICSVLWQGTILMLAAVVVAAVTSLVILVVTWDRDPRWEEAHRHARRARIALEHWIYFRWIHPDAQFWVVHVRFDKGPIVVEGFPPRGLYWNLTWYRWTESNPALSSLTTPLDEAGRFRIVVEPGAQTGQRIPVRRGVGRGLLYLRVYEPDTDRPTRLPRVTQNGRVLVQEVTP